VRNFLENLTRELNKKLRRK